MYSYTILNVQPQADSKNSLRYYADRPMRISRVPPQDNHVFPRRTRLPTYVPRRMQQRINVAKNCNLPAKHGRLLIFLSGWYPDAAYRLPLLKSVHTDEMLELLGPALRACSAGGGIFIITGSIIVHVADPVSLSPRVPLCIIHLIQPSLVPKMYQSVTALPFR